jgi:hypothetical protein
MSHTSQYHKRQARAIWRRRRTTAACLQRDHTQAQRAIEALEKHCVKLWLVTAHHAPTSRALRDEAHAKH